MKGTEVGLPEMLLCRERRSDLQRDMIAAHHCPLVSFSMNIPGPIKTNARIRAAFEQGKEALLSALNENGIRILQISQFNENTGDELMLAAAPQDGKKPQPSFSQTLKSITSRMEDTHPLGRLFDMDVIEPTGEKLSRPAFRKCLICGRQAQECARSRTHTVKEMQDKIDEMLTDAGLSE